MQEELRKVIVFIPTLNEEDQIARVIKSIQDCYGDSAKRGFVVETLMVDDGCTDNTVRRAEEAGVTRIVHHPKNLGLGAAVRTGMRVAHEMGADVAVKIDADMQHDSKDIEAVIQPILQDTADIVWGSRFAGEITYRMPLHRRWGNKFFTWLMNVLTDYDISDAQTGLMAFDRRYLACFQILADYNNPQQLLLDANSKHMRYMEVPVVFHKRETGSSFVSFRYPLKVIPTILWMITYANPMRVFVPLGQLMFLVACLVTVYDLASYWYGYVEQLFIHWGYIILFALAGLQTLFFGVLADMIRRIGDR